MHPVIRQFLTALCTVLVAGSMTATKALSDAAEVVQFSHLGVQIVGKPLPDGVFYDIDVASATDGAETVRAALDILYTRSPFNARAIDRLKAAGKVIIIYDPAFPPRELTKITIAAFLPDFYQKDGKIRDFLAVVGRFGGKWSPRELAPVLAHELTGHGIQHLRGRLDHVREVDLECEAYLYQENAYQDLGFDKDDRDMIRFRQTLERHWCADFRTWQIKHRPEGVAYWDKLHPDVPRILDDYLAYIDALKNSGFATRAVARARAEQNKLTADRLQQMAASSDPEVQFQLALVYARGLGVEANPAAARTWFEKAAEANHPRAQYEMARIYWQGDGVPADKTLSAQWAKAAANNDVPQAAYLYGAMLVNGDGVARDRAEGRRWIEKAAKAGIGKASEALKKLP
ncbi:MAG: tetratricopeptide repeat protein [Rhodospirillales bacterium]